MESFLCSPFNFVRYDIDGLVQETRNSSALALELHLSCTKPSIHDPDEPVSFAAWAYVVSCLVMASSTVCPPVAREPGLPMQDSLQPVTVNMDVQSPGLAPIPEDRVSTDCSDSPPTGTSLVCETMRPYRCKQCRQVSKCSWFVCWLPKFRYLHHCGNDTTS